MRKNLGARSYTYPQPVFIVAAYSPDGTLDAMNAAHVAECDYLDGVLSAGGQYPGTGSFPGQACLHRDPGGAGLLVRRLDASTR